ncbi:hypothetical protein M9H77_00770 [Catharanthus roseus]|uniref:Uncharacterized protein n=1 Tax=Catharanthus roseus TaxID=4058 RepID=A0ACC0C454_CATRO|nr:hypothetical protein M9H77_00770 [Catharanthus roseus]
MDPYADATCILSMNVDCQACKMQVVEVLSSIIGVYSVDIDSSRGQVRVCGEVDPNTLLKALARTGRHAKVEWAKLNHPIVHRSYHNGHGYGDPRAYYYNYGYGGGASLEEDPYCNGQICRRNWGYPPRRWSSAYDCPSYNMPYFAGGFGSFICKWPGKVRANEFSSAYWNQQPHI